MKKCSKCGAKMIADQVFASNPPQYLFKCPSCGNTEYGPCSELVVDSYGGYCNIGGGNYSGKDLSKDDNDEENEDKGTINDNCTNWNSIRNWAAMFAMNGLITSDTEMTFNEKQIASMAVSQANELIRELQKR